MPLRYWLMKTEPGMYSIDDLERDGSTPWNSIRNYQSRNFMRDDMKVGDGVLFYHSQSTPPGVAGVAKVASKAYPDHTALDPKDPYFDPKATDEDPRWVMVDVKFGEKFKELVPLAALKAAPALEGMLVTTNSRLSIQPVEKKHFDAVVRIGRGGSRGGQRGTTRGA